MVVRSDRAMKFQPMTVSEVARALNVAVWTVRAWGDNGKLPMQRTPGGTRIFDRVDVDKKRKARESSGEAA
jgi:excisionase family DNA binding protein